MKWCVEFILNESPPLGGVVETKSRPRVARFILTRRKNKGSQKRSMVLLAKDPALAEKVLRKM